MSDLKEALQQYWGHSEFRPKQEEIVRYLLAGRDVAVVMPTGGGKSLCYQLPPVIANKTCIVISPLISLMEDQAAQLAAKGIAAAALHSGVEWSHQLDIFRKASRGEYRLLYLSPERMAKPETVEWLQRVPVEWFAIDEAHCISDWGHEFRRDYRLLGSLRDWFPKCAIAAFTASATPRVRKDILDQLKLRDPGKFIVSFHRPNLRYITEPCDARTQEAFLLEALDAHQGDSVILYAGTTKSVDETAMLLKARGIRAVTYHGKLESEVRQRNQDLWMRDEANVMVATLAFGLGINKPSTRAVIHLSLPKSVEQYYQEAGRAGRDGAEADCILLWQKRDLALLAHFIEEIQDEDEKRRGWQRYREIKEYAAGHKCRARYLCEHFGETPKWGKCGKCDYCVGPPEWLKGEARKSRVKTSRKSLLKSLSESPSPKPIGRAPKQPAVATQETPQNATLRSKLREWRTAQAVEAKLPPFMILSDAVLEQILKEQPRTLGALLSIKGLGPKKLEQFGRSLLQTLET